MRSLMDLVNSTGNGNASQGMQKTAAAQAYQQNRESMYKIGEQMAIRDIRKIAAEEAGITEEEVAGEEEMSDEEKKAAIMAEMEADPSKKEAYEEMAAE